MRKNENLSKTSTLLSVQSKDAGAAKRKKVTVWAMYGGRFI